MKPMDDKCFLFSVTNLGKQRITTPFVINLSIPSRLRDKITLLKRMLSQGSKKEERKKSVCLKGRESVCVCLCICVCVGVCVGVCVCGWVCI